MACPGIVEGYTEGPETLELEVSRNRWPKKREKLAGSGHQSRTCLSCLIVASLALGAGQTILL